MQTKTKIQTGTIIHIVKIIKTSHITIEKMMKMMETMKIKPSIWTTMTQTENKTTGTPANKTITKINNILHWNNIWNKYMYHGTSKY